MKIIFAALLVVSLLPRSAFAGDQVSLSIPDSVKPVEAILIPNVKDGNSATVGHRTVEIVKSGLRGQTVKVALESKDVAPGTLLTVVGHVPGGEMFASPLQEVGESTPPPQRLETSCKAGEPRKSLAGLTDDSLRKLIDIRERKKQLLIDRLKAEFTPELYSSFRQQEKRFGLNYSKPLDETLNSDELVDRLLAIVSLSGLTEAH